MNETYMRLLLSKKKIEAVWSKSWDGLKELDGDSTHTHVNRVLSVVTNLALTF